MKKGKIISVPITESDLSYGKKAISGINFICDVGEGIFNLTFVRENIHLFKKLVVEYKVYDYPSDAYPETYTLPLKYSQWQKAINNDDVDSDKEIEFEVEESTWENDYIKYGLKDVPVNLARILYKERVYKESDVKKIASQAFWAGRGNGSVDLKVAMEIHNEWLKNNI